MCRNNNHIVNININGTNGYVFGKDENWLTYSRYEPYYLKHRVDNNKEYLQIPGTTWANIRRYRINKKRTRRGCRGGKPKLRLNMGLHTKNLVNITTVTEKPVKTFDRKLKLSTINVRSIQNKHLVFMEHLIQENIDICVVTEVWLNTLNPTVIADLNTQGYVFTPIVREQRGGGIAISHRDNMVIKQIDSTSGQLSFEFVEWKVITKHHSFSLLGVYHPPPSEKHNQTNQQFIDEFTDTLVPVLAKEKNVFVLGDFNIHVNDLDDPDGNLMQDWLTAFGLENHVSFPTHKNGKTLDLVLSKYKQQLAVLSAEPGISVSDHTEVVVYVDVVKPALIRSEINIRKVDGITTDRFTMAIKKLQEEIEATNDPNELASLYSERLKNILDELAPSKAVVVTKRPQFPWFDNQSGQLKRAVRLLERRWRHHRSPDTWRDYSRLRNVYARHLWNNKRKIISKQVLDCQYNSKKLYTLVNNLTGRTGVNPIPQDGSETSLPNRFADFFLSKIQKIRDNLSGVPLYHPRVRDVSKLNNFEELSHSDVYKILMSMKVKSCELDPLPAKVFRRFSKELTPIVAHLVNISIRNCFFPWSGNILLLNHF